MAMIYKGFWVSSGNFSSTKAFISAIRAFRFAEIVWEFLLSRDEVGAQFNSGVVGSFGDIFT